MKDMARFVERFRKLCLSLPEAVEVEAWGHPNFRAGKKTFSVFEFYKERPCIAVKMGTAQQAVFLDDERFFETPYIGKHGWVSLWVDGRVDWTLIEDLVLTSYRLVAPKRMITKLEEDKRRRNGSK